MSVVYTETWRSETCRQLNEETATTSSTAERDEVDHQQRLPSSSWPHKMRRRIQDISLFNKTNYPGTERNDNWN